MFSLLLSLLVITLDVFNSIIEIKIEVICKEKSFNPCVGCYGSWTRDIGFLFGRANTTHLVSFSIDNKAWTSFIWIIFPWLGVDTCCLVWETFKEVKCSLKTILKRKDIMFRLSAEKGMIVFEIAYGLQNVPYRTC